MHIYLSEVDIFSVDLASISACWRVDLARHLHGGIPSCANLPRVPCGPVPCPLLVLTRRCSRPDDAWCLDTSPGSVHRHCMDEFHWLVGVSFFPAECMQARRHSFKLADFRPTSPPPFPGPRLGFADPKGTFRSFESCIWPCLTVAGFRPASPPGGGLQSTSRAHPEHN